MNSLPWTEEQAAAITAPGHTLLVANAGTGKTTTVVGKVRWLLGLDIGLPLCADPATLDRIAAITFTEKAAYDLKEKLRSELLKAPDGESLAWELERASLGTIHSFCGQLLRDNALRLGIDAGFGVLDEGDARVHQDRIIRDVLFELLAADDEDVGELIRSFGLEGVGDWSKNTIDFVRSAFRDLRWHRKRYEKWAPNGTLDASLLSVLPNTPGAGDATAANVAMTVAQRKKAAKAAAAVLEGNLNDERILQRCRGLHRAAQMCVQRWRDFEDAENVRDFDSLILDARDLLTGPNGAAALFSIRRRYRILIIDEFQDTDGAQRDIAYAIAGIGKEDGGPQLFLVGDPKQSIYRFRGADIGVWNAVQKDFATYGLALRLSENFRSDPAVVDFINVGAGTAIDGSAGDEALGSACVPYSELTAGRTSQGTGAVEWILPAALNAEAQRADEAERVARRIQDMVGHIEVVDIKSGKKRECTHADIAVLYRARTGLQHYLNAFWRAGIPFYQQGAAGMDERQEVLDLLNFLRVVYNPADDLCVFAFLRSPFVGLRDDVLTRVRLEGKGGRYLAQARHFLENGEWYEGADARIGEIEKPALRRGLAVLADARTLADRIPIDELLEHVLAQSGYREHLLLMDGHREALANIRSFVRMTEQYRDHTIGAFLEVWDDRDKGDPGLPEAPLYSSADNVVTFSTVHAAKGLEWPVVFLIDVGSKLTDKSANTFWSDAEFGPILCPRKEDRGARSTALASRQNAQMLAEEARLLYVAITRARDRLIIAGLTGNEPSYANWLLPAVNSDAVTVLNDAPRLNPIVRPRIDLQLLERTAAAALPPSAEVLPKPPHRWLTSATELMSKERDPKHWELIYQHAVDPVWQFAPRPRKSDGKIPERLRGTLIHGVLERYEAERDLAEIVEETIGELDAPELEVALQRGGKYREALEDEIARVVASADWQWYVAGEHYREMPFLHLVGAREWHVGSFDLYRPDGWIIDFKTHQIPAHRAPAEAEHYRTQMRYYREAAAIVGPVQTRLHFTYTNTTIDLS
jgi:ATP-dependent helicase/nuclease subunit A